MDVGDEVDPSPSTGPRARRSAPGVLVTAISMVFGVVVLVISVANDQPTEPMSPPNPATAGTSIADTADLTTVTSNLFSEIDTASGVDSSAADRVTSSSVAETSAGVSVVTVADVPPATAPPLPAEPAVVARPIPVDPPPPPPEAPAAPWAAGVVTTKAGHVSTDVGCVSDLSAPGLDAFFAERVGPVIGWDYQHVYPLGGNRHLWLFQDTFVDHSNTANTLDGASFVHNAALIQDGNCFRLLHRGTVDQPEPFELGTGTTTLSTWFWPMGGEVHDGRLHVFWARMVKDEIDPPVPDGLGWHPETTYVAIYDPATLARIDFRPATQPGVSPIYGYAVQSDGDWTYLFGNSFEQNLSREGGWANGPHSATRVYLARVPRGALFDQPTYWTPTGWSMDRRAAAPVLQRHWAEFPFQPRLFDGRWVAVTAVDGYWGDEFELDVANDPWGPWTTVESRPLVPRGADPRMNTYHAHLMPWRDGSGDLVVSVSNNARNMARDAWPNPARYRPMLSTSAWRDPPAPVTTTSTVPTTSSTTAATTSTSSTSSTSTSTTAATTTSSTSTSTTTSSTTSSSSTTTTIPDAKTSTTSTTTSSSTPTSIPDSSAPSTTSSTTEP